MCHGPKSRDTECNDKKAGFEGMLLAIPTIDQIDKKDPKQRDLWSKENLGIQDIPIRCGRHEAGNCQG